MLKRLIKKLPDTIAAIDLGSNSFHLLVAKPESGNLLIIDQIKEMIQLGAGLDQSDRLTEDASKRALECLHRFGQRISNIPVNGIRAVATGALRKAVETESFLEKAKELLGHEIEIISGAEEARLTYIGVSHNIPDASGRRMIIDIGGASTEVVLGERFDPLMVQSFDIGSATLTQMFFPNGEITRKALKKARLFVMMELEPYAESYKELGWGEIIGTAGTIKAVEKIINKIEQVDQEISLAALDKLVDEVSQLSHFDELKFDGLKDTRRSSFVAGLMILKAIFDVFKFEKMKVSNAALREGILYDLIGRDQQKDVRLKTISDMAQRYSVDVKQANHVEQTSTGLLDQVAEAWGLDNSECASLLSWVSKIHEVGLTISHSQYHKHSEYILKNSVLLGFSRHEQQILSTLVRLQRSGYHPDLIANLPLYWQDKVAKLAILLRLSVLMHRSRNYKRHVDPVIKVEKQSVSLTFPEGYLEQHPLTLADLEAEKKVLGNAKLELVFQ